jgi:hypothetical protein
MLQALSNELLVERFGKLVRTERKISHLVIACIAEIETRKIYLDRAYPSLFEYLTKEFGYSESAAYRRISAARLLRQVPEIAQKIEEGRINLSQASLLVQTVRTADKLSAQPVTKDQKLQIFEMIEDKSFQHSQQIIHRELGVTAYEPQRLRTHGDGSVTISFTLTPEQAARWQQVAELTSHAVESHDPATLLDYLAQKEIARRTEIKRASPIRKSPSQNPRRIAPNVRKVVIGNSQSLQGPSANDAASGCNYRDPVSGRRCGSRHSLQVDHKQSVWAGGNRDLANLQALCGPHNRRKYQLESGIVVHPHGQTQRRSLNLAQGRHRFGSDVELPSRPSFFRIRM